MTLKSRFFAEIQLFCWNPYFCTKSSFFGKTRWRGPRCWYWYWCCNLQSSKKIFGLQNGLKRLFCITIEVGIDIDVKMLQNFMIRMSYIVMDINCSIHLHMNFWSHEFINESLATVLMVEKVLHVIPFHTSAQQTTWRWDLPQRNPKGTFSKQIPGK